MSNDNKDFFEHQTASSRVKATIVSEYFPQYCKIIARKHMPRRFGYIDLFAGPGIYADGCYSTPILVGRKCYNDPMLRERVWMVFNDMTYGDTLRENFESIFPPQTFVHEPFFASRIFGEWPQIDTFLTRETMEGFYNECPSLLFIDPFGYKHINTRVLAQFLTRWGNEVFIFINTKRLNAAFENDKFLDDLRNVFPTTFKTIRKHKKLLAKVVDRHFFIIQHLAKEFEQELGSRVFYTAFQFREENQETASHYLLHITKGAKGYELIKQIYSRYDNVPQVLKGVHTYTFDPKRESMSSNMMDEQFRQENIEHLKDALTEKYREKRLDAATLFKEHQQTSRYAGRHYRLALRQLAREERIRVEYTDGKNHRASVLLIPECIITFK